MKNIQFTPSQTAAYNTIMTGYNVFLTGDAGTGKSFLLREAIDDLRAQGKKVLVTAPTGIAALEVGGMTLHRALELKPDVYCGKKTRCPAALKTADVLVIDEISMMRLDLMDYLGDCLRKAGHTQVIAVGDFCQLPPVMTDADRSVLTEYYKYNVGGGYAFQSTQWKRLHFRPVVLREVVRQDDHDFVRALDQARRGRPGSLQYFAKHASAEPKPNGIYLCGRNSIVDAINGRELSKLPGQVKRYHAKTTSKEKDSQGRRVVIRKSELSMAPQRLELKVGARVMALVNDSDGQYRNGSLGTVSSLGARSIEVSFDSGMTASIKKRSWEIAQTVRVETGLVREVIATYRQYPLRLAWAVTIHKSQGQTFDAVNLNPECWDSGQLYVALSRVRTIEGLYIDGDIQGTLYDKKEKVEVPYLYLDGSVAAFYDELDSWEPEEHPDAGIADGDKWRPAPPKEPVYEQMTLWEEVA